MPSFLLIETATDTCSVALSSGKNIVACKENFDNNAHSSCFSIFIAEVLKTATIPFSELDSVVVSAGPGSYTGLRIGVSSAKGICYAVDKPLIAVDTLASMTYGAKERHPDFDGLFCPMIDARRMEVYSAFFDKDLHNIRPTAADIVDEKIYTTYLQTQKVLFFGNGAEKCQTVLSDFPNACFDTEVRMSARNLLPFALYKFEKKFFEDVAYFEPFYLKDFVAVKSKVKGLS